MVTAGLVVFAFTTVLTGVSMATLQPGLWVERSFHSTSGSRWCSSIAEPVVLSGASLTHSTV